MRSVFSFISLFTSVFVFGQFNITCLKLTDTTKSIFYIGVDNPIRVLSKSNSGNYQIALERAGGSITKMGPNEYIIRVSAVGLYPLIIKQNGKQVLKKDFQVFTISQPIATLAGMMDTMVSRNRILLNPFLSVVFPNCYFQFANKVVSFTATFINGEDSIATIANGNFLSQEQINLVKKMSSGSNIYFDNIRENGPDGRTTKLPPFWIKIK